MSYSTKDYKLTDNEQDFIQKFLYNNGCGAETPSELLGDNYSCQCIEDLREEMTDLSPNQIGGYLASLQEKGVLTLDERMGPICEVGASRMKRFQFEPDLYWANEDYLEQLDPDLDFRNCD